MGYLTPLLFRNDDIDMLRKDPHAIEEIIEASTDRTDKSIALHSYHTRKHWWQFWIPKISKSWKGCCVNAIESLGTRDACENRVIVVLGNTWVDLSSEYITRKYNHEIQSRWDDNTIDYLSSCIKEAEATTKSLKKLLKEHSNDKADK